MKLRQTLQALGLVGLCTAFTSCVPWGALFMEIPDDHPPRKYLTSHLEKDYKTTPELATQQFMSNLYTLATYLHYTRQLEAGKTPALIQPTGTTRLPSELLEPALALLDWRNGDRFILVEEAKKLSQLKEKAKRDYYAALLSYKNL